jgi:hypothetical protein
MCDPHWCVRLYFQNALTGCLVFEHLIVPLAGWLFPRDAVVSLSSGGCIDYAHLYVALVSSGGISARCWTPCHKHDTQTTTAFLAMAP